MIDNGRRWYQQRETDRAAMRAAPLDKKKVCPYCGSWKHVSSYLCSLAAEKEATPTIRDTCRVVEVMSGPGALTLRLETFKGSEMILRLHGIESAEMKAYLGSLRKGFTTARFSLRLLLEDSNA